jgi:hypothetical protein
MPDSNSSSDTERSRANASGEYYGIGAGRRKALDALDAKDRLATIDSFEDLEDIKSALREISLKQPDGTWYRSPPEGVIEFLENVHDSLPADAQKALINDGVILRRVNAARRRFNDWMGKQKREKEMPSPVEAGFSNYPGDKARKRSESAHEARETLETRLKKVKSGIKGGKQRSLQSIGSSLAEHNEKQAQSMIERRREELEKGDIVGFRNPNLHLGAVFRVNQKSVRIQFNEPRAGETKPLSDEEYGEHTRTTIDLDSTCLKKITPGEFHGYKEKYSGARNIDEWPDSYEDAQQMFLGDALN